MCSGSASRRRVSAAKRSARRSCGVAPGQRRGADPAAQLQAAHAATADARRRRQQRARVRLLGRGEDVLDVAGLDDRAVLEHEHAVADLPHDRQVVGDQQDRQAALGLQAREQRQDLRLRADVERGDRLVADQRRGLRRQRAGDRDALALPAGELRRAGGRAARRRGRPRPAAPPARRRAGGRPGAARAAPRPARRARSAAGRARSAGPAGRAGRAAQRPALAARAARSTARRAAATSPASGASRPSTIRASVLLPEPDSPTTPSVSPARSSSDTPSTARRAPL